MKKFSLILVLLALSAVYLPADEAAPRVITGIEIIRNKPVRTGENSLRRFIDLEEGQEFADKETFDAAIDRELRDLKNTRYFASVTLDVVEGEMDAGGRVPAALTVTTSDAWTILPIPYPIPDSQIGANGWQFGLEVTYDNFFGTMTDFYIDGYVNIAFGEVDGEKLREWKVQPKWRNVDIGNLNFSFALNQNWKLNEKKEASVVVREFSNYQSAFSLGTDIELGGDWNYNISPSVGFKYLYDWKTLEDGDNLAVDTAGNYKNREDFFYFDFDHNVSWGSVDWIQTFRKGFKLTLSNGTSVSMSRPALTTNNQLYWNTDLNLSAKYYVPFAKFFNYYTRAQALIVFNDIQTGLGSRLRGVENSTMSGNTGFFWQHTLVIQPHRSNTRFNFQLHPFVDVGLAFDYLAPEAFADMLRIGAGSELVFLIGGMNLRARFGYDFLTGFIDFSFATTLSY